MIHTILLFLGIFIMCSIFTFIAITFRTSRLPRKQQEMARLQRILGTPKETTDGLSQLDHILQEEYKGTDYILPVFFVTLFCALGLYVLFSGEDPLILTGVFTQQSGELELAQLKYKKMSLVSIGMAILGSYIWSIQYIVKRAMNLDLVPGAYYTIGTRIILATFVSVILHHYIQSLDATTRKELLDVLPVLAFLVGFFPQRVLQYLQEKVFFFARNDKLAHKMPLEMIEGINLFSRVRLAEVGIDNAQNLAESSDRRLERLEERLRTGGSRAQRKRPARIARLDEDAPRVTGGGDAERSADRVTYRHIRRPARRPAPRIPLRAHAPGRQPARPRSL